jgi:creatinine amidohydrolase
VTAFGELTSPALGALRDGARVPVAMLPVGAVEPHGPHAPLATDTLISQTMCRRAAEALADDPQVAPLVLPALPYGVTRYGSAFPGAIGIAEATLEALVTDLCGSLARDGVPRVAIVNNHFEPEQVATLRRAAERAGSLVALLDLTRREQAARLTAEFRSGSCHAGRYETSLVLAEAPQTVDAAAMRALPALHVDMPAEIAAGRTSFTEMGMERAYCGAPAEASAAEGEETFDVLTEMLVELVRELAAR